MCIETDFTLFAHGRCMLLVESRAQKLLEEISEVSRGEYCSTRAQNYLDKVDDLREDYTQLLAAILKLAAGRQSIVEYRETAGRIEAIFGDCRESLLKKVGRKVEENTGDKYEAIPKFGGIVIFWVLFREAFQEHVLYDSALSREQKMEIFISKVSSKVRSKLPRSTDIYTLWNKLCQVYDKDATRYHLHNLMNLKENPEDLSLSQVENLVGKFQAHLKSLEKLGHKLNLSPQSMGVSLLNRDLKAMQCFFCSDRHTLRVCDKFQKLKFSKRYDFVLARRLCVICFNTQHVAATCPTNLRCRYCHNRHNIVLHPEDNDIKKLQMLAKHTSGK